MPHEIFISYRHEDEPGLAAQALFGALQQFFSVDSLFLDVDGIPPGEHFQRILKEQVARCQVMLVIIGRHWLTITDQDGRRRLDNPNDFVRIEIESAMQLGKRVVPVVMYGGKLPRANALPESLKTLVDRQAVWITQERFGSDTRDLIEKLRVDVPRPTPSKFVLPSGGGAVEDAANERPTHRREVWWNRDWPSRNSLMLIGFLVVGFFGILILSIRSTSTMRTESSTQPQPSPLGRVTVLSLQRAGELAAGSTFKECDACPEMIVAPLGSFKMGSAETEKPRNAIEGPQREVAFKRKFAVGRFAVTFDEWDVCLADGGCGAYRPEDSRWGRGRRPAINISWVDAGTYVRWLAQRTGVPYRLLTEAEREYVARSGKTTPFWWGNSITTDQANYDGRYLYPEGTDPQGEWRGRTVPVDTFNPNPWGLYQVHGNVWEWVEDCMGGYDKAPNDGSARTSTECSNKVLRGGSWYSGPIYLTAATRLFGTPEARRPDVGFRVARTLAP